MFDDPGPFFVRPPEPRDRRIVAPGTFAQLLDQPVATLRAGDELLGSASHAIATVTEAGLDAAYVQSIGVAEQLDAEHAGAGDDLTADTLDNNGTPIDALRDQALPHLPPVDSPIAIDFAPDPPVPGPTGTPAPSNDTPFGDFPQP